MAAWRLVTALQLLQGALAVEPRRGLQQTSGQFRVEDGGPCTVSHSGSCVGRPSRYSASERCLISFTGAGSVESCPVFNTESNCALTRAPACAASPSLLRLRPDSTESAAACACALTDDFLYIDGTNYDGENCPREVALTPTSTITWESDGSVAGDGWEICVGDGSNSCRYARDGECDDGSTGGTVYCNRGTDAEDCSSGTGGATSDHSNSCEYAHDNECDDGSIGDTAYCTCGTDADDCAASVSSNSCEYAHDNECDDGSTGGTRYCTCGTDADDCGSGTGGSSGTGGAAPPPPPARPPPPATSDSSNSCRYARDGECDDGSTGFVAYCSRGTDAEDCGNGTGGGAVAGGQFSVISGPCTTDQSGSCVGRLHYDDSESCEIRSNMAGSISGCPVFMTEQHCTISSVSAMSSATLASC